MQHKSKNVSGACIYFQTTCEMKTRISTLQRRNLMKEMGGKQRDFGDFCYTRHFTLDAVISARPWQASLH